MSYIDGMIASVPTDQKDAYAEFARVTGAMFREFGATAMMDAWGDDVPDGKVADFKRAVQAEPGETVVFSWMIWPDKATRDAGMAKAMADPRMTDLKMPFDGQRMIFGGFQPLVEG